MWYVKNVPLWERVARAALGLGGLGWAALNWHSAGALPLALAVGGASLALTGLVGFCPMCALVGRKLDRGH